MGHGRGVQPVVRGCRPAIRGGTGGQKRGLFTDFAYWIFAPVVSRYMRIWVTVLFTIWLFGISDGNAIAGFYLHGHGRIAQLPLWLQDGDLSGGQRFPALLEPPRLSSAAFCGNTMPSIMPASRWNGCRRRGSIPSTWPFGTVAVDIAALLSGFSPDLFLFVGPFNVMTSCFVHANLDWTLGRCAMCWWGRSITAGIMRANRETGISPAPLRCGDLMFGTFYMPRGALPRHYGIDDANMARRADGADRLSPDPGCRARLPCRSRRAPSALPDRGQAGKTGAWPFKDHAPSAPPFLPENQLPAAALRAVSAWVPSCVFICSNAALSSPGVGCGSQCPPAQL